MPIRVLDPKVVSRIAAGEVVERPASVVKELVENSLDAGATQISVEAEEGGTRLIRVVDNGCGIPAGELLLAFKRYATSKIARLDDLGSVTSLGFRGEALPSIAQVAEVEVITCARGEAAGSYLALDSGAVVKSGRHGRPVGTTVTVRNLFRRLPARLKFLKSKTTEAGHIAGIVSQYALAFPEVSFNLSIDGRTSFSTPGSGRLLDSVAQLYGIEIAGNMLPIMELEGEGGTSFAPPVVSGMISTPRISRSSRGYLSLFVNRRLVNSRLLAWAVEEAYHALLMVGKHPVAIINLSLPPDEVDVNVHPAKLEVRFRDERFVFNAVQKAVRQTLTETLVPGVKEPATEFKSYPQPRQIVWAGLEAARGQPASAGAVLTTPRASLPVLRLLGQLESSYIVAEGPDGLYLLDQHAAHERILFEKIVGQSARGEVEVQGLLEPETFEVSPRQAEILKMSLQNLAEFGFSIEPFGDRTYLVRSLPALLSKKDWRGMLEELLDSLSEGGGSGYGEKIATTMACHSAVRAGQVLAQEEMRQLIRDLEETDIPNTCPHGRPTVICLSSQRLKKEFGRT